MYKHIQTQISLMKKIVSKLLILLTIFLSLPSEIALAAFTDLGEAHKNYEAITYLQENGIINGYDDGSFKPDNTVNRAEFLKIIIDGSKIKLSISPPTPFKDVDNTAWYAKYLKKAYAENWINGYSDNTFRPDQAINKVEALKIIAKVQNWEASQFSANQPFSDTPLNEWYIPYIAYAKEHNFLEETGLNFSPSDEITRGGISEIIFRTLKEADETDTAIKSETTPPKQETPKTQDTKKEPTTPKETKTDPQFTPVNFNTTSTDFFDNISLESPLPNTFYKNEVYIIKGTITVGNDKYASVILDGTTTEDKKSFSSKLINNKFEIPIHFRQSGNYSLGIIPGESGSSKAISVSVLKDLPASTNNSPPSTSTLSKITFSKDTTSVSFDAPSSTLKKLTFSQNGEKVSYISRQNLNSITVLFSDFKYMKEEEVSYFLETATISSEKPLQIGSNFNSTESKKFNAIEHSFDFINEKEILPSTSIPDIFTSPEKITITGDVLIKTKTTSYVTKPDGLVEEITLTTAGTIENKHIPANSNFSFSYTPKSTGRYIIETVNQNGEASLNHPVYIGNYIPLIPDFLDLYERKEFKGTFNITNQREALLALINEIRQTYNLPPVVVTDDLNGVAQGHAEDMAANNYFSHTDSKGLSPDDRRLAAGIKTYISENLAKDTSVEGAHYGLLRSGTHRQNILGPDWARVGLGIKEKDGYLYVVQEFSTFEVTSTNLTNYQ
ncbi:MAG: S-layer homology domain-containing protein, partial [Patescibacteria group bacterium]